MDKIAEALQETSLLQAKGISYADILERGIAGILKDEALKKIPIIKTIIPFYKIYKNVKTYNLFEQTMTFLLAVDTNNIPKDKLDAHKKTLEENPEKAKKERFFVLLILDQNIYHIQSLIFGSFYRAYLNQDISWNDFCELAEANT